jgi:serine phosphatase RsbU (regulator of sigma subunit)
MRTIFKQNGFQGYNPWWAYNPSVRKNIGLKPSDERLGDRAIELEEKHLDMVRSIQYASRIQESMLPSEELFESFFEDHFIINRPKEIVSGDFYWMNNIYEKIIFTIADCTGHGVPGAFMSILGIMLLNQITVMDEVIQPDKILNILRARVIQAISNNNCHGEMKEGLDLALCVFDPVKQVLQYAGALDRIYLIRDHALVRLEVNKFSGNLDLDHDMDFRSFEIKIMPGDVVYLFTDGYPDQFGGENNKKFTVKRFRDLLMKICRKKMARQKQILENTLLKWQGSVEQLDDITVLGIKF